jgi:hypothetical protein
MARRTSPIPPVIHYVQLAPAQPKPKQHPLVNFLHKVKRLFEWRKRTVEPGETVTNSMAMDDTESLPDTYESDFASSVSLVSDI